MYKILFPFAGDQEPLHPANQIKRQIFLTPSTSLKSIRNQIFPYHKNWRKIQQ